MDYKTMDKNRISGYREGYITKDVITRLQCCTPVEEETIAFRYLDIFLDDGTHQFVYEDDEALQRFKENFHKNRFTSFHEFLTTEELAEEDRGVIVLKYYVPRNDDAYSKAPLQEAREWLKDCKKLPDRVAVWGKYDRQVDYHL